MYKDRLFGLSPEEKYYELCRLFKVLSDEMCKVVEAFYIWRTLFFSRSVIEVGDEQAHRNVAIVNRYKDFFIQTEHSNLSYSIIGLMKFYDRDFRALSINTLANLLGKHKNDITADLLLKVRPGTIFFTEGDRKEYVPINNERLDEIKVLTRRNKKIIKALKKFRNKKLAHLDMIHEEISFIPNEVEQLIKDTQEMFNKLSLFDRTTTQWTHLGRGAESDTKFLLENLERGEKERIREINQELGL
jgi:hypothetical protein